MKNRKYFLLVVFIAFTLSAFGIQDSPEYKILFEKAKFTMETKGDLNGAINLFNDIIKKYPKEREYAAKSQLYIGQCYEKLGNSQARAAYERVVRDYADQSEVVNQAQIKLSSLNGHGGARELVTRRVLTDATGVDGVLTPDGKYISHIDGETGDLVQFEVSSGQTTRITNGGLWSKVGADLGDQVFSRDGKQIAYGWWTKDLGSQVRIRNLNGSGLRTLYSGKDSNLEPLDWSPDAGSILAVRELDKTIALILISTVDGTVRVLKSFTSYWMSFERASFSPDGQTVAFSFVREGSPPNGDVFLMTTDGRNEVVVAGHPAEDNLIGWTPDGRSLVFLSDRSGTWDIWTVHITGGKQQGEPVLLKKDFGYYSKVFGFTPDGYCYYKTVNPLGGLFEGTIDLETGKVIVPPAPVTTRYTGPPHQLRWSPDGKNLLYISCWGFGPGKNILTIRSTATGEERFLSPHLRYVNQISWAPDGRSIIAHGSTEKESAIFRIDMETSGITKLADNGVVPHLCPDGKTLVFVASGTFKKHNLETGEESEIAKGGTLYYDLSPDGQEVVFHVSGIVKTESLKGGEPRELYRGPTRPYWYYWLRWTRDGRYIIAQARGTDSHEILRIPARGGTPLKLDLSVPKMESFELHPDNSHFAYSVDEGSKSELWVMENFLPK